MGVIGSNSGGYATVVPRRNYVGEALANIQDGMYRQKAQRTADEKAKADAERQITEDRRRDFTEAQELAKQNPFIATGTGLDASNKQAYMNAKDALSEAKNNYNTTGDRKYLAVAENAIASIANLSEIPNKINAIKENWIKNVGSYNPQSLLKKEELLNKLGTGEVVQTNDANGNARYSFFNKDENGNLAKVSHKELSAQQLLALLEPVKSFNVTGEKGLVDQFQKSIGKQIPKEEIIGGQVVKSLYTPGSEEIAKTMAKAATQNKAAVYTALQELGLDPEIDANYTNPDVLKQVSDLYENILNKNAPKVETSRLPNYEEQKIALQKTKEVNDQRNSDRTYNQQERNKTEGGKDITYTEKEDYMGKSTSTSRKLTEKQLADIEAEAAAKNKKYDETKKTREGIIIGRKGDKWFDTETDRPVRFATKANEIAKATNSAAKEVKPKDTSKMSKEERLAYYRNLNKKD